MQSFRLDKALDFDQLDSLSSVASLELSRVCGVWAFINSPTFQEFQQNLHSFWKHLLEHGFTSTFETLVESLDSLGEKHALKVPKMFEYLIGSVLLFFFSRRMENDATYFESVEFVNLSRVWYAFSWLVWSIGILFIFLEIISSTFKLIINNS